MVFETPIPLAEEQRKILQAIANKTSKFITVEGPPGTGKSHTISAIVFEAIKKKQSVLVLSDKKEALDVVENKLNETLKKVRPSDDFINPILRLGRDGSNFAKVVSTKSIEALRVLHRESKSQRLSRRGAYESAVKAIKENIQSKAKYTSEISLASVSEFEMALSAFKKEWGNDLDNFDDLLSAEEDYFVAQRATILALNKVREQTSQLRGEVVEFAKFFGDDASSLADAIDYLMITWSSEAYKSGALKKCTKWDDDSKAFLQGQIDGLSSLGNRLILSLFTNIDPGKSTFFSRIFSKTKVAIILRQIETTLGYTSWDVGSFNTMRDLQAFTKHVEPFYRQLSKRFGEDSYALTDHALKISPCEFDASLAKRLLKLDKSIVEEQLPYMNDDESILDILTASASNEADFYVSLGHICSMFKRNSDLFNIPENTYINKKNEIETYHALELANEIDGRVIEFSDKHRNDAKTLRKIITEKKKFPKDHFENMKEAFPCMICGLRDYAEYIPLVNELFDLIIIDEASQVSIAQALPAILRGKKIVVMGDRKQFGNVKTGNASKELNHAYFRKVQEALKSEHKVVESDLKVRANALNVTSSVLDFAESLSNFNIMLRKHFRGYPEMISFSSKYFYGNNLQAMKIRGQSIEDVLEFVELSHDGMHEPLKNTNQLEAELILERLISQLDRKDYRTVAVITPFTAQQTYVSKICSEHQRYQEFKDKLKFRCFTFDSCQGEERDIIYYSFVANPATDRLYAVLPKSLEVQDEEELDHNKRLQRVNVAFSRGKEKLVFIVSKPINELSAGGDILRHYQSVLERAKAIPTEHDVDPNSVAEKQVLEWIQQMPVYMEHQPEVIPQFRIGEYLKSIDDKYNHPKYRVDFLRRFVVEDRTREIIVEYDGFEYHFRNQVEVDAGNWEQYLSTEDVEREYILESYGYKILRINKFNRGDDPIQTLSDRISQILIAYADSGEGLVKDVLSSAREAHEGFKTGLLKHCKKCGGNKPKEEFASNNLISGYGRFCNACKGPETPRKKRGKGQPAQKGTKTCPNCLKSFPLREFVDNTTKSGRRRLCGACKRVSVRESELSSRAYFKNRRY